MTNVSPEERLKAKATEANLAVVCHDATIVLGVGAVVVAATGVGALSARSRVEHWRAEASAPS